MDVYFGIYIEKGKKGWIINNVLIGLVKDEMLVGNVIYVWDVK